MSVTSSGAKMTQDKSKGFPMPNKNAHSHLWFFDENKNCYGGPVT